MSQKDPVIQTDRKVCHKARDEFFKCMDETGENDKKCRMFYKIFKDSCPESWVAHFIRKRKYEAYKQGVEKMEMASLDEKYKEDTK